VKEVDTVGGKIRERSVFHQIHRDQKRGKKISSTGGEGAFLSLGAGS